MHCGNNGDMFSVLFPGWRKVRLQHPFFAHFVNLFSRTSFCALPGPNIRQHLKVGQVNTKRKDAQTVPSRTHWWDGLGFPDTPKPSLLCLSCSWASLARYSWTFTAFTLAQIFRVSYGILQVQSKRISTVAHSNLFVVVVYCVTPQRSSGASD